MTAKGVVQSEDDIALELALGICSMEPSEEKPLNARVCGTGGYNVTITEARIGHLDHKLVLKGNISEGDKAFGWKGFIPGLQGSLHSKGVRFAAASMPAIVVHT